MKRRIQCLLHSPFPKGLSLAACLLLAAAGGCSKPSGPTLKETTWAGTNAPITAIAQLDLTSYNGLLTPRQMHNAREIKRVTNAVQINTFSNIIATAGQGKVQRNHPGSRGQCILRVETTNGIWLLFCEARIYEGREYSVINVGAEGETNQNATESYESYSLPAWFATNGFVPKY